MQSNRFSPTTFPPGGGASSPSPNLAASISNGGGGAHISAAAPQPGSGKPPTGRPSNFTFDVGGSGFKQTNDGLGACAPSPLAPIAQVAGQQQSPLLARSTSYSSMGSGSSTPHPQDPSSSPSEVGGPSPLSMSMAAPSQPMLNPPSQLQLSRAPVYVVWDVVSVPFPFSLPANYCLERVHKAAELYGTVESFKCITLSEMGHSGDTHGLAPAIRRAISEHGVEVEEVMRNPNGSSQLESSVLLSVMAALVQAQQYTLQQPPGQRQSCSFLLLSSLDIMGRALLLLRRSKLFDNVVVVWHSTAQTPLLSLALPLHPQEPAALVRNATSSLEWSTLLRHGLPPQANVLFDNKPARVTHSPSESAAAYHQRQTRRDQHGRSSSHKDLTSLLQQHQQLTPPAHPNTQLPPLHLHPQHVSMDFGSSQVSSTQTSPFHSRSSTPQSRSSTSAPFTAQSSSFNSRSSSVCSSPDVSGSNTSGRTMMGSVIDVPVVVDSNSDQIGDLTVELMLQRLQPRIRAYVLAFQSVLKYCETERIIPRESVLKKRLMDTQIGNMNGGPQELDFEQILQIAVEVGIAAVEGRAPQRIIYPRDLSSSAGLPVGGDAAGSTAVRKFEAADFFRPQQRLSVEESRQLLAFLQQVRPEVDRGRFGFAQYLSLNAPPNIRTMPHGVLVELVQLLLNQKILLFRKGRVSVNPNLPYADLQALASLSVASKPHTALLSTTKGQQGQQAAQQLRYLYQQMAPQIDAYNRERSANGNPLTTPPVGTVPSPPTEPATAGQQNGAQNQSVLTGIHPSRPFSAPSSPTWSKPEGAVVMAGVPAELDLNVPDAELGSFEVGDDVEPGKSFHLPAVSEFMPSDPVPGEAPSTFGRWRPTPPFEKTGSVSYIQVFAHKFLQSKWGPLPAPLLSNLQRFPFAALWHADLSMLRDVSTNAERWSATCSFDIGRDLHTFTAVTEHERLKDAHETLAEQILDPAQDIVWRLTHSCLLQELKAKRRKPHNGRVLPFMALHDEGELADLEREEREISAATEHDIQQKLLSHPVLFLDCLLSMLNLHGMIYSCERVEISSSARGKRLLWSVAAQLPAVLLDQNEPTPPPPATSIKEHNMDAKMECASDLLATLRKNRPQLFSENGWIAPLEGPALAAAASGSSRPSSARSGSSTPRALSAKAPAWVPPSFSSRPAQPVHSGTPSSDVKAAASVDAMTVTAESSRSPSYSAQAPSQIMAPPQPNRRRATS